MNLENTKPFNLDDALSGKKVITRSGHPIKNLTYNPEADPEYRLVGWVRGKVSSYFTDGKMFKDEENELDLFISPDIKEYWACLWEKNGLKSFDFGNSKEGAERMALASKGNIIKTSLFYEEVI